MVSDPPSEMFQKYCNVLRLTLGAIYLLYYLPLYSLGSLLCEINSPRKLLSSFFRPPSYSSSRWAHNVCSEVCHILAVLIFLYAHSFLYLGSGIISRCFFYISYVLRLTYICTDLPLRPPAAKPKRAQSLLSKKKAASKFVCPHSSFYISLLTCIL